MDLNELQYIHTVDYFIAIKNHINKYDLGHEKMVIW